MALQEILNLLGGSQGSQDYYGPATSRANDLNNQAESLRMQSLAAEPPAPVNPAYRSPDLLTGLLPALLLGTIGNPNQRAENVAGFTQGYVGGKQKVADQKTAIGQQKYTQDQQRREQAARSLETRAQGELRTGQAMQVAQDRRNATKETLRARMEQNRVDAAAKRMNDARKAFLSAKTQEEIRFAGKAAIAAGVEELDDAGINARIAEVERDRRVKAFQDYDKAYDQEQAALIKAYEGGAPQEALDQAQSNLDALAEALKITGLPRRIIQNSATYKRQQDVIRNAQRETTLQISRDRLKETARRNKELQGNWVQAFGEKSRVAALGLATKQAKFEVAKARFELGKTGQSEVNKELKAYTLDIKKQIDKITQDMQGLFTDPIENAVDIREKAAKRKFLLDKWREVDPVVVDAYEEQLAANAAAGVVGVNMAPPLANRPPSAPVGGAMNAKPLPKGNIGKPTDPFRPAIPTKGIGSKVSRGGITIERVK